MPKLIVVDRAGQERHFEGEAGLSVMEVIRDNGLDELMALCGGCCSCATCHIFVDTDWVETVGGPSEDESDLLESSDHRRANSRLSCQVPFTDALDGLKVHIAPEE